VHLFPGRVGTSAPERRQRDAEGECRVDRDQAAAREAPLDARPTGDCLMAFALPDPQARSPKSHGTATVR
jgi:hypothetical protein